MGNPQEAGRSALSARLGAIFAFRETILILVLVVGGAIMTAASPVFLTWPNLEAILLGLSVDGPIVGGMATLLVSGGLDLSVGSTLAFTGVVVGLLTVAGVPAFIAILLSLLAALAVGMANGLLIAKMKMNPFIITLGMMITVRGLLLIIARGRAVLNLPASFPVVGQGKFLGVQYPIYVVIVLTVVGDLLLRNTRFFRQNYYVGGKEQAARLSGIKVDFIKIFNYCLVAVISGVSGLMITARFGSSSLTVGSGMELRVLTAAVIGGASFNGGEGSVLGAMLGALFMGVLANALNLLGVDVYWQNLVTGLMLILAVVFDTINERRKEQQK